MLFCNFDVPKLIMGYICLWLVNSFSPTSYTLELYNSSIKISANDVEFIMGLKAK